MNQKLKKVKKILVGLMLVAAVAGFSSCEKYTYTPPEVDPITEWKLNSDIQPIFEASCVSCHGGTVSPDLRTGKSFNALSKGGYVALPAETSKLYKKVIESGHSARTTATEKLKILYWITQGAKNN
jgi:hypothetical protein